MFKDMSLGEISSVWKVVGITILNTDFGQKNNTIKKDLLYNMKCDKFTNAISCEN